MNNKIFIFILTLFNLSIVYADCPSVATLNLESSGYKGLVNIELRKGNRPGSTLIANDSVNTRGTSIFTGICAGRYFYAFGTPNSDQVSTTQYFDVINDGERYSMSDVSKCETNIGT